MAATSRRYSRPSPPYPSSSTAFAHSSSSFAYGSSNLFTTTQHNHQFQHYQRSMSPPRVNLRGTGTATHSAPTVRFSLDRPISPNRSISSSSPVMSSRAHQVVRKPSKKTCMCSPTTHPGSFRCSLHKNFNNNHSNSVSYSSPNTRLNARRSAMTNSLVRICGVEGDLVKRALSSLIRPSSHQQRRRAAFQPRSSRLSVMSKAEVLL